MPAQRFGLLVFHDSAEQVGFAVLQADFMLDLALSDDGLADATDVLLAGNGGNVHRNLQRDFAVGVDMGRDVDVDAHIQILELRVDQRVDADAADAGLERSGRDRHAVADLQRSLLPIQSANLWILKQLGVAVVHHSRQVCGWNRDLEVGGVQVAECVQVYTIRGTGAGGAGPCRVSSVVLWSCRCCSAG